MQLNRFDLNLLIALDALLHEKNVTRAAERISVGQQADLGAVSHLLGSLSEFAFSGQGFSGRDVI